MVDGGLSWFLVVFLGFFCGFSGQELETTEKTKKNHEFWILRDSLKMVVFRELDHQTHCKNQEKPRILDFER